MQQLFCLLSLRTDIQPSHPLQINVAAFFSCLAVLQWGLFCVQWVPPSLTLLCSYTTTLPMMHMHSYHLFDITCQAMLIPLSPTPQGNLEGKRGLMQHTISWLLPWYPFGHSRQQFLPTASLLSICTVPCSEWQYSTSLSWCAASISGWSCLSPKIHCWLC